jgi:hypothetical protein
MSPGIPTQRPPDTLQRTEDPVFDGISKPYISGQISGLSADEYHEAFGKAEALLMNHDLKPVNPLKVVACATEDCTLATSRKEDGSYLHSWECYLKHDIQSLIMECDSIAMLPNWTNSRGAKFELHVARELGYPIFYISRGYKTVYKGVGIS